MNSTSRGRKAMKQIKVFWTIERGAVSHFIIPRGGRIKCRMQCGRDNRECPEAGMRLSILVIPH